ncbi:MAG: endonuclease/exonuclease/phosphatase family protein [Rhodobacteraceae bacterium]|nr:endonuclease/exonuclease/phosphatase family protein [Paracoccaceae bacterium]
MPPFPQPPFPFQYSLATEISALRRWRDTEPGRAIPAREDGKLLLGSWNIANLGDVQQQRSDQDIALIAEMLTWFDLTAVQEVKENLEDLQRVQAALPQGFEAVMSDQAGNDERMVFVYNTARVTRLELAGEIAIPPASHRHIKLPTTEQKFKGFDRNPFAVAFRCADREFTVVNAHLYFGKDTAHSRNRRALESYALGRWADLRDARGRAYSDNVVVIGDLNMPAAEPGDPVFDALTKRGLRIPEHQSRIGTTITDGKHYDQLAFLPGDAGKAFLRDGVFDFDGALFADLWNDPAHDEKDFDAFIRFHISDHRPIWAQFEAS